MFENIDFSKMGDMLKEVQDQAKKMEEESKNKEFIAKSGGGLVKVSANGNGEIIDIFIDDSLMEDKESMQILLMSGINDVLKMVEENKKSVASKMLGSLGGVGK